MKVTDQRKAVADTEIQKQIWTKPRWRIWIHPIDFKKARFKTAEHCREFMIFSYVVVRGWMPYPWFSPDALQTGEDWVTSRAQEDHANKQNRKKPRSGEIDSSSAALEQGDQGNAMPRAAVSLHARTSVAVACTRHFKRCPGTTGST